MISYNAFIPNSFIPIEKIHYSAYLRIFIYIHESSKISVHTNIISLLMNYILKFLM